MRGLIGIVCLVVLCLGSVAARAQDSGGVGLSQSQTLKVVSILKEGFETCSKVAPAYKVDCFQQSYRAGAKVLSHNAGYWEAEVALTRVSRNLYQFVRANTDTSVGRLREGGFRMKAVTQEAMPQARKVFRQNVARAETLLRDVSPSEAKYFAPIADVIGQFGDIN
ncbi:hypothetical protein [Pelagimonas sp. KU-00592-HH]|uniref:hypothetical protein n=1 Tax=Pelagimonas sp. KU-00592-HH TaxID=3127651 RepID=UPI00333F39A4